MAEETHLAEPAKVSRKRNIGKKGSKGKKKPRTMLHGMGETKKPKKIDKKMKNLFRKRAREYNSDDDDDDDDVDEDEKRVPVSRDGHEMKGNRGEFSGEEEEEEAAEGEDVNLDNGVSDDEEDSEMQPGITKFTEGVRGFSVAFKSIINKSVPDDSLGPMLSAHKNLVVSKLAEEDAELKVKGEAKKEKHLVHEKGHVKPTKHLDSHEKFLIGVATKGVVKLFNAVNKAQNAQKGLNPSRSKDVKAIRKRRKEAFFSELGKTSIPAANTSAKAQTSTGPVDGEGPSWAPLRDNYMLTNSKLKDWDKMADTTVADDIGRMSEDSSSDDD